MIKPGLKRTRLMTIRVSPEEWIRITKAANEDDCVRSVSDWLRQAVMEKLGRDDPSPWKSLLKERVLESLEKVKEGD
jgi:hypothetical protein